MDIIKEGYLRVTDVLKRYVDFSHIDPVVLSNASLRGQEVHGYCELIAQGIEPFFIGENVRTYVNAFKKWFCENVHEVFSTEKRYYCERLKITGQVDLIARLKGDNHLSIIDYKCTSQVSKSWAIQTGAYLYLHNSQVEEKDRAKRRIVLHLPKTESEAKLIEFTEHERDISVFMGILSAERFFS